MFGDTGIHTTEHVPYLTTNPLYMYLISTGTMTESCSVKTVMYLANGMLYTELGALSFFPGSLSAQFLSMDRYRSIAHFADFQVLSSLNRSKKNQWFALGKEC